MKKIAKEKLKLYPPNILGTVALAKRQVKAKKKVKTLRTLPARNVVSHVSFLELVNLATTEICTSAFLAPKEWTADEKVREIRRQVYYWMQQGIQWQEKNG